MTKAEEIASITYMVLKNIDFIAKSIKMPYSLTKERSSFLLAFFWHFLYASRVFERIFVIESYFR